MLLLGARWELLQAIVSNVAVVYVHIVYVCEFLALKLYLLFL